MIDVSLIPGPVKAADPEVAVQLLPLVYNELRRLAAHKLAQEPPDETMQPTVLVHEAYLRLLAAKTEYHWVSRGQFIAAAAEAMRRILVDHARSRRCGKHWGGMVRHELEEAELLTPKPSEDLVALDEALNKLAATDRAAAYLVQLRYFGGLTIAEAAAHLGISSSTAKRLWTYARTWLFRQLKDDEKDSPAP
jgi:RNA polymerase sigma factor (TIGR02999 family)